jgi:ADP-ribose pyrophosphatase YjhB (NUDIX family)
MDDYRFCPRCATALVLQPRYGKERPVCPACGFVHCANPRVAVVLFLADRDRILLVKRGMAPEQGRWALVAGFVDLGEHPEAAARREMREETGLEVAVVRLLGLDYDPGSRAVVLLYRARLLGGTLAAGDDADDAQWFTRDQVPDLAFESTRRCVRDWLAGRL